MSENQTIQTVQERVNNGWRWLSENFPGWQERVDPRTLNLYSGDSCICGQVFKDAAPKGDHGFYYAYQTLFSEANSWISGIVGIDPIAGFDNDRANRVSAALGFNRYFMPVDAEGWAEPHGGDPGLGELKDEWVRRLTEES